MGGEGAFEGHSSDKGEQKARSGESITASGSGGHLKGSQMGRQGVRLNQVNCADSKRDTTMKRQFLWKHVHLLMSFASRRANSVNAVREMLLQGW